MRCWFRRCRWKAISAGDVMITTERPDLFGQIADKKIKKHVTVVCYECSKCNEHKTKKLSGHHADAIMKRIDREADSE